MNSCSWQWLLLLACFQTVLEYSYSSKSLDLFNSEILVMFYLLPWENHHETTIWENMSLELFPSILSKSKFHVGLEKKFMDPDHEMLEQ